jgi:DNA-binding NarL/FixJ family response regulator
LGGGNQGSAVRVVLAEDSYIVREGVVRLLESADDLELARVCGDLPSLLAAVDEVKPDVVITDIRMPPTSTDEGIQAANTLRTSHPTVGVVVLSQHDEAEYALKLFEGGSAGRAYLLKDRLSDPGRLTSAIRAVATGGSVVDAQVVDTLVAARQRSSTTVLHQLTARELAVLSQMAQGKNNSTIAHELRLSLPVVEKHINAIFSKLALSEETDIHRRVMAVLIYLSEPQTRSRAPTDSESNQRGR